MGGIPREWADAECEFGAARRSRGSGQWGEGVLRTQRHDPRGARVIGRKAVRRRRRRRENQSPKSTQGGGGGAVVRGRPRPGGTRRDSGQWGGGVLRTQRDGPRGARVIGRKAVRRRGPRRENQSPKSTQGGGGGAVVRGRPAEPGLRAVGRRGGGSSGRSVRNFGHWDGEWRVSRMTAALSVVRTLREGRAREVRRGRADTQVRPYRRNREGR